MGPLFLDTGYLIAILLAGDQYHRIAIDHWNRLADSSRPLVTTSFVLCEAVAFFQNRGRHATAVEIGSLVMHGENIRFVNVDRALLGEGLRYLEQHRDKPYSLTDCVSFVLMDRLGLRTALTFDHHFTQAGFEVQPRSGPNPPLRPAVEPG